ncbi:MAG: hypothetical protein IPM69_13940 [Ignavibacteria bacterium]|nr:hypothetical protein [Ignavibacteria bacterium]
MHGNSLTNGAPNDTNFTFSSTNLSQTAVWRGTNAKFSANISSPWLSGISYSSDSSVHEVGYNSSALHTRLLATTSPVQSAASLTLLAPFETLSWHSYLAITT